MAINIITPNTENKFDLTPEELMEIKRRTDAAQNPTLNQVPLTNTNYQRPVENMVPVKR